jgi:hypothetical protein
VVVATADLQALRVGADLLLFDGEVLHRLAGTAAEIFEVVDGRRSVEQMVDLLTSRHGAEHAVVRGDVERVVDEMTSLGLVSLAAPGADTVYCVPGHVAHTVDEDIAVILDLRTGERLRLASSGRVVWGLLARGVGLDEALRTLSRTYPDEPPARLRDDVRSLVDQLVDAGLLDPAGP